MTTTVKTEREILNRSFDDTTNTLKMVTVDSTGGVSDSNNPLPTNGDSLYAKDIDMTNSNLGNFSGLATDFFDDLHSVNTDITGNNPKVIDIRFTRAFLINGIGIGSASGGMFSNVKIYVITSGDVEVLAFDDSTNNTPLTTNIYRLFNKALNLSIFGATGIKIEFHTVNDIEITNISIPKFTTNVSLIQGQNDNGVYTDFKATNRGSFKVALTEYQGDAFGRMRVSEPYTVFDNTQIYDNRNLFWSELSLNGTAVQNRSLAKTTLAVSAGVGNYQIDQTKQRFKYQPGKSTMVLLTGVLTAETDVTKGIGFGDFDDSATVRNDYPQNGIFFLNNNGAYSWNISLNGTIAETATQSQWSEDKLDGTGLSGLTFDDACTQIWFMDMEWLGVGSVRVGFVFKGEIYVVHKFHHANENFQDVYMNTANLAPIYFINSQGGAGSMEHICCTVISEGGFNPIGISRSIPALGTAATAIANNVSELVVGMRLKGDSWNATVDMETISVLSVAKNDCRVDICMNPTYTGTVTWTDLADSTIQYAVNNNNVVSAGGTILSTSFISGNTNNLNEALSSSLKLGKDLAGDFDEIWIVITAIGGADSFYASMQISDLM